MGILINDGSNHWERKIQDRLAAGTLIGVHKGVYIEAKEATLCDEVRKHWLLLTAAIVPNGVLTDRTGMESLPSKDPETEDLHVFVSAPRSNNVFHLPGLVINVRRGAGPHEDDPLYVSLPIAGMARRMLDNLVPSRARSGPTRTVGRKGVEIALDHHAGVNGIGSLKEILRDAERIATDIGREAEHVALREIITAFQDNRPGALKTKRAQARSRGMPEDEKFLTRFAMTVRKISEHRVPTVGDPEKTWEELRESCFMDAYFSNYIEGTRFLMGEARDIVIENRPTNRIKDGHDIQATFEILMGQPKTRVLDMPFEDFLETLRRQHAILMRGRPEVEPGMFKSLPNRAGTHRFVEPEAVIGTMTRAWDTLCAVKDPFAAAMALHFLIAGVHPFNDGNGRMSRVLMNQELRANGLCRIIVPTISRQSYIAGLRNISDRADVFTFMRSMETFQGITAACVSGDSVISHRLWASTYAFCDDEKRANLSPPSLERTLRNDAGLLAPEDYWETIETPGLF